MFNRLFLRFLGCLCLVALLAACADQPKNLVTPGQKYEGTDLGNDPAPDLRLTNQHGQSVALSDFRGKVVALTFLDSHCEHVCPLTAIELRHAAAVLGPANADRVAFVAVNVNHKANTPADVEHFTHENKLDELPNWHFLTGAPPQLEAAARAYYVYAVVQQDDEIAHTSGFFIIDAQGKRRRYLDVPPELAIQTRPGDLLAQQMRRYLG